MQIISRVRFLQKKNNLIDTNLFCLCSPGSEINLNAEVCVVVAVEIAEGLDFKEISERLPDIEKDVVEFTVYII